MMEVNLYEIHYSYKASDRVYRQNTILYVATDTLESAIAVVRKRSGELDVAIHQAIKRNQFDKAFVVDPRLLGEKANG